MMEAGSVILLYMCGMRIGPAVVYLSCCEKCHGSDYQCRRWINCRKYDVLITRMSTKTMLNKERLFKFKFVDTTECNTCKVPDDDEHLLFHCRKIAHNSLTLFSDLGYPPNWMPTFNEFWEITLSNKKNAKSLLKFIDSSLKVLIKVRCCAVNVADTLICSGKYDQEPNLPFIPGYEFSGEVLQVGPEVEDLYVGNKVIGLNKDNFSTMATECISESRDLWKIPESVSFEAAAALVDSYATVLIAARRANLHEDDTVLVTAAAGGLGLAAVDIASNLFKAKVIGACDTEDKANLLREKGAFSTINYKKKEISKAVLKETNNEGVNVVFDAVGGDIFKDCLQSIAAEGCIVVLGFSSRKIPHILTSQLLPKSCALIGVSLTHYQKMINETYRSSVKEIIDLYLGKFIDPHIAECFKLDDVNDAIKHVEERKSAGKVILYME